jgi:hypothetical protein
MRCMTPDEITRLVEEKVREELESQPVVGVPVDPDQLFRLRKLEVLAVAMIRVLAKYFPDFEWAKSIEEERTNVEMRLQRNADVGIQVLDRLLDERD